MSLKDYVRKRVKRTEFNPSSFEIAEQVHDGDGPKGIADPVATT